MTFRKLCLCSQSVNTNNVFFLFVPCPFSLESRVAKVRIATLCVCTDLTAGPGFSPGAVT